MNKRLNNKGDISIEAAIILPLLLIFVIGLIQLACWWYTEHLLKTAAREGIVAARLHNVSNGEQGRAAVREITDQLPKALMEVRSIDIEPKGDDVVLTLNARLKSVVLEIPYEDVQETAKAPLEEWVT